MSLFGNFFGSQTKTSMITSALDLVTMTAGLASAPSALDPVLDKVRTTSARLQPGEQPSGTDEVSLLGAYLDIERYLTTNDPIRTFTRNELRSRLSPELLARLQRYEKQHNHGV